MNSDMFVKSLKELERPGIDWIVAVLDLLASRGGTRRREIRLLFIGYALPRFFIALAKTMWFVSQFEHFRAFEIMFRGCGISVLFGYFSKVSHLCDKVGEALIYWVRGPG